MIFKLNPNFQGELKRRIEQGLLEAGKTYVGAVITEIENAPRGGTALNKYGQRRSAPGEVFAQETGAYRAALGLNRASYNVLQVVITDPEVQRYAAVLEHGSRTVAARPVHTPVLLQRAPDMMAAFANGFKR